MGVRIMLLESNLALMQRDANYLYLFTKFSFRIKKKNAHSID